MAKLLQPRLTRVSAAAVGRGRLAILTLDWNRSRVRVDAGASIAVNLAIDGNAVAKMRTALDEFLGRNHIRELVLRRGPETGPYSVRAIQTKLEFLVEHGLQVAVTPVSSSVVGNWLSKHDPALRLNIPDAGKDYQDCQLNALRTGLYAFHVLEGAVA